MRKSKQIIANNAMVQNLESMVANLQKRSYKRGKLATQKAREILTYGIKLLKRNLKVLLFTF